MLIQLQFVKKELLVAMRAIDQLINANQVNLQLLAITPAIIVLIATQMIGKLLWLLIQSSTSKGKKEIASKQLLFSTLRIHLRQLERDMLSFSMSMNTNTPQQPKQQLMMIDRVEKDQELLENLINAPTPNNCIGSSSLASSQELLMHQGKVYSDLYRIHQFLLEHQLQFDPILLEQFQEDLRDIWEQIAASSTVGHHKIADCHYILDRMYRYFSFLQPHRNMMMLDTPPFLS